MSNSVSIILLCEDERHKQFVGAFLKQKKRRFTRRIPRDAYRGRQIGGVQSNNAFVSARTIIEIDEARKVPPKRALIVMIDGDNRGFLSRCGEIAKRLKDQNKPALSDKERIALVIPCRNIETWVHHFAGHETDETQDFKSLYLNSSTLPQAGAFADWVSDGNAEAVVELPALNAARDELRRLHELMK